MDPRQNEGQGREGRVREGRGREGRGREGQGREAVRALCLEDADLFSAGQVKTKLYVLIYRQTCLTLSKHAHTLPKGTVCFHTC